MKSALRLRLASSKVSQQMQSGGLRNGDELLCVCSLSPAFTVREQENQVTYKMPEINPSLTGETDEAVLNPG